MTRSRALALLSAAGTLAFLAAVLALHGLQPAQDPISVTVSEYVLGHGGWLFTAGCAAWGLGSLALATLLARTGSSRTGGALLTIWATGILLVAIFPTDPIDRANQSVHFTTAGIIHAIAGQLAFICFGVAAVMLTRAQRSRGLHTMAALCAATLAFAVAVTALGQFQLFGLAERLLLSAYIAWSLFMTAHAGRKARPGS
ncbi:DUF998 domain-containing protein [Sphaerisporangium aureirubrum]|uniref:DUF998 domain-containing protein n=1 Tax=Sphaerisporangium aureirubrum TaxID=1544736 RepID=A0ABW1NK54_9ACTN